MMVCGINQRGESDSQPFTVFCKIREFAVIPWNFSDHYGFFMISDLCHKADKKRVLKRKK